MAYKRKEGYKSKLYNRARKLGTLVWLRDEKVRERNGYLEAAAECDIEIKGLEAKIEKQY